MAKVMEFFIYQNFRKNFYTLFGVISKKVQEKHKKRLLGVI
jgi:predicted DCC family thiol-disulfide oxidoreductase YuxK